MQDDNVVHIAGNTQHLLGRLGIKIPRALCGVLLVDDPGKTYPDPGEAPDCPRCADLARRTS